MAANPLSFETVWLDKSRFDDAERVYHEKSSTQVDGGQVSKQSQQKDQKSKEGSSEQERLNSGRDAETNAGAKSLASEIKRAREQIKLSIDSIGNGTQDPINKRVEKLESENAELRKVVTDLKSMINKLETRVNAIEGTSNKGSKSAPQTNGDDDDVDLFGSGDEDDTAANELRDKRLKEYAAKKSAKPGLIAKSSVVLEVKPWDDETDLPEMEKLVRSIEMDGLKWGASKFVPIAYNIKKLQIVCVVEDEKVGIEDLSEKIQEFEDFVQSVDVAAFNKI